MPKNRPHVLRTFAHLKTTHSGLSLDALQWGVFRLALLLVLVGCSPIERARTDAASDTRVEPQTSDVAIDMFSVDQGADQSLDVAADSFGDAPTDAPRDVFPDGPACDGTGQEICDGQCVDTRTSRQHCGACNEVCPSECNCVLSVCRPTSGGGICPV